MSALVLTFWWKNKIRCDNINGRKYFEPFTITIILRECTFITIMLK